MHTYSKLAIASAVALALLNTNNAYAHVTYNTSSADRDQAAPPGWSWTDGEPNPAYTGNLPANWVAMIHNGGGVAQTLTADSTDAGFQIGMGARAYKDGSTNWGHTADFGLFHLEQDALVTITVNSDGSDLRPAFGLWNGWADTGTGSRHDAFLGNGAVLPMAANPLGPGLAVVDANAWAYAPTQGSTASATLTRYLLAGNYTLILGGYDGTTAGADLAYSATISASPVPIPAAIWGFASGLAGLGVFGRHRKSVQPT